MALAMFSALNFLAKAYRKLVKPERFVDKKTAADTKRALEQARERCPDLACNLGKCKTPQEGECNESNAFTALVKALVTDNAIDLGLPNDHAQQVWLAYRNNLAHVAQPKSWVDVFAETSPRTAEDAKGLIASKPPFSTENGTWRCNADRLSIERLEIAKWLCGKVDKSNEPRTAELHRWLFEWAQ